MAMLTRHPKLVDTARGDRPKAENSLEKAEVRCMRGLSSATTTQVRTHPRAMLRALSWGIEPLSPLVQSSITPGNRESKGVRKMIYTEKTWTLSMLAHTRSWSGDCFVNFKGL